MSEVHWHVNCPLWWWINVFFSLFLDRRSLYAINRLLPRHSCIFPSLCLIEMFFFRFFSSLVVGSLWTFCYIGAYSLLSFYLVWNNFQKNISQTWGQQGVSTVKHAARDVKHGSVWCIPIHSCGVQPISKRHRTGGIAWSRRQTSTLFTFRSCCTPQIRKTNRKPLITSFRIWRSNYGTRLRTRSEPVFRSEPPDHREHHKWVLAQPACNGVSS